MRQHLRLILIAIIVLVTASVAGLIWYLGDTAPRMGQTLHTGQAAIGGPFSLTDQFGHTRSDKDFAGRYMLIYFGYTNCPDVCPTTLSVMAQAMTRLGSDAGKVVPIFITVDPARDSPKALKPYMAAFGPEFVGLTGPMTSIKVVTREYRVYFKAHKAVNGVYAVDHSNTIYLMGPDGRFIANYVETMGPGKLAAALKSQIE
jgi:protein SCO1/2